ncbi:MAG: succinate dehydrogenase, cytochrome b556 subunit [Acidimicrobiia bacterium]
MLSRGTIYKGKTGMWAFTAHRVTGFLVLMFLLLHVVDVTLAGISEHLYDTVHAVYGNILLRLFEVGLLGALVFHALNGLRIIAVDFFDAAVERQKQLAWVVAAITAVVTVAGGIVIVLPFFTHKPVF